jgi:hypothetical protein
VTFDRIRLEMSREEVKAAWSLAKLAPSVRRRMAADQEAGDGVTS